MGIPADKIDLLDWMPVICNRKKPNGHYCCSWLGAIDKTRAGNHIHYCSYCKVNYIHTVCDDGRIELDTVEGMLDFFESPVTVGPLDVFGGKSDTKTS